jgi:curli biogenesis system outer membrane secretion channel CsgG
MKISPFSRSLISNTALALITISIGLASNAIDAVAQTKLTIAVPEFKNTTTWWWWRSETSRELADALSNELNSTGKFTIVERQKLGAVLSEQELAELGLVRQGTEAKKGQLTGSQYIILGQITSYEEGVSGESTGVGVSGIDLGPISLGGGGRKEKQEAYVAIDLRVVNSTTGDVTYSRTVEGRATSKSKQGDAGVSIGGINLGGDRSETNKAPVGKALRAALIEATNYLSCVMVDKDECIAEFEAKEQRRRQNTQDVLQLD